MSITWNTGPAAMRARHNLKLKKKKGKKIRSQARKRVGPPVKNQAASGRINWFKKKFDRDLKHGIL